MNDDPPSMTDPQPAGNKAALSARPERRRTARYVAWRMVRILAIGYAVWCGGLYLRQSSIIFPRDMAPPPLRQTPREFESIWIEPEPGVRVEAWFARGYGVAVDKPGATVIFLHGNAELIDQMTDYARAYRQMGVNVLLPEYRGYGRSGGTPSEAAIAADLAAFHDLIAKRSDVDPRRIFYHGKSIGGGAAAALAARREPAALILESTFTSVAAFARGYFVPEFLCRHPFHTDDVVRRLKCPILIFHGDHDEIVPVEHGRTLHRLAPGSTYVEMPAGHLDLPPDWDAYMQQIETFLRRAAILPERARPAVRPASQPRDISERPEPG